MSKENKNDVQNRCRRCDRPISDPNAIYGWRCAQIVGLGNYNKVASVLDNVSMRLYNAYVDKYLSLDKVGRTGNFTTTGENYKSAFVEEKSDDPNVTKYKVITDASVLDKNFQVEYEIVNGVARFNFEKNDYWSILSRGGSDILAKAMYDAAKEVVPDSMSGRTVGGINRELQLHWAAYKTGIDKLKEHASTADMGGMDKDKPGYDSNAWVFEAVDIAEDVILKPKRNIGVLKEIWRYIR